MCRVGKIGRRKVFPKVKNVNVKSLKNDSKLLDFWSGAQGVTRRREGETKSQRDKERKSQGVKERKRRRDEARHLLLPFPVLRSSRSSRSLRSLQTLQTLRTICSNRSIRTNRSIRSNRSTRSTRSTREIRVLNSVRPFVFYHKM